MKAVIMAGGRGTRISSIYGNIPKPMIPVNGKPVLEHEIECLRTQGFTDIIITVSYMSHIIINYFGDGSKVSPVSKKPFEVHIEYFIEEKPLGNAGALFQIKNKLTSDFLLLNADSLFDIDFNRFVQFHKENGGLVTLFTHPNNHPYDSGLIIADEDGKVVEWLTKEDIHPKYYQNRVNAGIHIISPQILNNTVKTEKVDLDRQLLKPIVGTGKMYIYDSPEYVKDMGTPERYKMVCKDVAFGMMNVKNLRNKQKAIFLDRDGTINRYVGFLKDIVDFELLPGVAKAIKGINESGYLTIVITNQPVIARGDVSVEELQNIHNKMETLLGDEGAYLDAVYYCPHHPDKGFCGERIEYKINCDCRKPKVGMFRKAANKFNIDLSESWMIGDEKIDIEAGKNAGCKTVLIGNMKNDFGQDVSVESLEKFVNQYILK